MKNIIIKLTMILVVALFLTSCEDYLGGDTNIDPNRTSDASLNTLLPTLLYYSAESTYFSASVACQYAQQIGAVTSGGTDAQNQSTFGNLWSNIYLNVITNGNEIIKRGETSNSPHYSGIAKIMIAYNLGLATSVWENIPFKEADNQLSNFSPNYDSQQEIYNSILSLLDEAINDLEADSSVFRPSNDDIVYKGDLNKWIKAAHSLKARNLLHLARKGIATYNDVLNATAKGISSNEEDLQLIYTERNFNPWYQVALANNTGNLSTTFSATFMNLMNGSIQGILDPRVKLLAYSKGDTYLGNIPGTGSGGNTQYNNGTSFFGWAFDIFAPLQMLTFSETKFIEAEALINSNDNIEKAYDAYLAGITANMEKIKVNSDEITQFTSDENISIGASNLNISHVMTEKYKALFLNPEVWNDLRAYKYSNNIIPGLNLPENHNPDLNGAWIQRGLYPTSETSRNSEVAKANFKPLSETMWLFKN